MRVPASIVLVPALWIGPACAEQPAPAAKPRPDPRPAYEANLHACVARAGSCDRKRLSGPDRDYVTYGMGASRMAPYEVDEVVSVRMEGYAPPAPVPPR